jgi:tRNA nucleotidyltransferase/poly(A) polymerase
VTDPLALARETIGPGAWLVGGAVRDRLLGRPVLDLDVALEGDAEPAARALARAARCPAFPLSDAFGAWRVVGPERAWYVDVVPLRGGGLEEDLALRDFTLNAMAEPLGGGEIVDPFGGRADLERRRLRAVGPTSFADDPLRVLRLARLACELQLTADDATAGQARAEAPRLADVSQERVFAELKRIVVADDAIVGLELADATGALAAVLPEVAAMKGVEQTVYHHRDAFGHTLEVFERAIDLERRPEMVLGDDLGPRVRRLLEEPLADELTRGGGLRFAALLHDAAKPLTAVPNPKGGYGFPGHDRVGAELVEGVFVRLKASTDLRRFVAALTRHHLRAGFLTHAMPLSRRDIHGYLLATAPVEADVTLLSVADRLATRGRKADEAIERHMQLVGQLLPPALDWHEHGPPKPLVRGDELARELGIEPGPGLGDLLAELATAQYAGEIATRDDAVRLARELRR